MSEVSPPGCATKQVFLGQVREPKIQRKKSCNAFTCLGIIHLLQENMDRARGKLGKKK
jgi:hypothetical protein